MKCIRAMTLAGAAMGALTWCDLAREDDFESLRAEVDGKLDAGWSCTAITMKKNAERSFELVRTPPSRMVVTVHEEEYLTQKEWEEHRARGKALFEKAAGDPELFRPEQARELNTLARLPDGTYRSIGVGVSVVAPKEVYPGYEREASEAEEEAGAVRKLLMLFHRDSVEK